MNRRAATIAMCMLMVVSTAPLTNAEGQEESSIWGITYDWSHFEGDAFNMTGVDVNDINADLSAAAEYAGFDMDYDEVLSGTTQVFVESWDEAGPFTVTTEDGTSHQVGKRITELTVRHGSMADTGMATNWSDGGEKIEAWLSAYQDYMLVMNANYVEYVDENMFVYGAEIALDSTFSVSMGFDAEIGVTAASETVSPDVSANMQLSFDIPNLEATWSPYEAVDYHFVMGSQPSSESGPGVDPDDDWHPYTYCSSEEFQTYQMCNEVEFEQGDRRFIAYHEPGGGELQGSFSSISSYSMEVSAAGLPTEEFDVDIDVFNVALSDSIPDQGLIYGEMAVDSYALWGHNCPPISNSETVTVDGTDYQAQCGLVLPVPWAMAGMMGQSLSQALESGVQELADVAMGEVEEVLGEVVDSGGGDDHFEPDFVCNDGETIPRYWFNDGYPDCSDGSDELASNDGNEDGFTCLYETWQVIPSSGVNDGYPDCYDGSDEEMAPEVWACAVDVRVDSLPDTSFESFSDKANEHPGFPEWCGEEVGELQIGDSQPNLPPPEDYYGAAIDDFGMQYSQARNATHWIQIGTGEMQDCSDENLSWHEEYSGCAEPAAPDIAIDGELIQGEWGFTRYQWSGDYLYLAVPVNEALTPAWTAMGPRVTDFICDTSDPYYRVPGWQVGDGVEDCYNGEDENPDASSDEPGDSVGSTDLESMFEALNASNLQKTMEAFSERLEILLQDNVPDEPKYDIEDLCGTMLWDPSDVRVLGVALVLEGGLLLGPQIENSMPHPTTTINVQFLSGQAARDAKSGASSQSSFDEMAPTSKHDLAKLYEILGPDYLPDLDTTDSDGDGTMDFFDSDDDNDGIPDWEDSEPKSLESEAGSSSLPAHGLVATLSVIAAAAMLIPRRED